MRARIHRIGLHVANFRCVIGLPDAIKSEASDRITRDSFLHTNLREVLDRLCLLPSCICRRSSHLFDGRLPKWSMSHVHPPKSKGYIGSLYRRGSRVLAVEE